MVTWDRGQGDGPIIEGIMETFEQRTGMTDLCTGKRTEPDTYEFDAPPS